MNLHKLAPYCEQDWTNIIPITKLNTFQHTFQFMGNIMSL